MRRWLLLAAMLMAVAGPAVAVNPDEQLADPALEARAHQLSKTLRCVVCQNQSIDDSDAALARDLRVILRERIAAGDTDRQAMDFLVERYGNFVRLKPPLQFDTSELWFGPLVALLLGGFGVAVYMRGRASLRDATLSEAEEAQVSDLLKNNKAD